MKLICAIFRLPLLITLVLNTSCMYIQFISESWTFYVFDFNAADERFLLETRKITLSFVISDWLIGIIFTKTKISTRTTSTTISLRNKSATFCGRMKMHKRTCRINHSTKMPYTAWLNIYYIRKKYFDLRPYLILLLCKCAWDLPLYMYYITCSYYPNEYGKYILKESPPNM